MIKRINVATLKKLVDDINTKFARNHVSYITVVNSTDVIFSFSFNNKEKLLISLNHTLPFIGVIDKSYTFSTVLGHFSDSLRKLIKDTYLLEASLVNNDRIIKFTLGKKNEFFEKELLYLVVELIPTKSNVIVLNDKEEVLYAYHYTDMTKARPIVRGFKYEAPINNNTTNEEALSEKEYDYFVKEYLIEASKKRKREAMLPLYQYLTSRVKSLSKKLIILNNEIKKAEADLSNKDKGDMIYAYLYDQEELNKYIATIDNYDFSLTPSENANKFYQKYKKAKRTIEIDKEEIKKTNLEIEEINHTLNVSPYLDEEEYKELYNKYLSFKLKKPLKMVGPAFLPYYIEVDGIVIAFGKNKIQNDYLTFKKSEPDYHFFHISYLSGSHVVIFHKNPNDKLKTIASEIALILSSQTVGEVRSTQIKNIKKGQQIGQVLLNNEVSYVINHINPETYNLLTHQIRFKK